MAVTMIYMRGNDEEQIPRHKEINELLAKALIKNGIYKLEVFYNEGFRILSLVDVDLLTYRKRLDNKSVRRNVTFPNWLNQEAEKAQINVSRVLQDALIATLNINP